jgi:hypothetical protein
MAAASTATTTNPYAVNPQSPYAQTLINSTQPVSGGTAPGPTTPSGTITSPFLPPTGYVPPMTPVNPNDYAQGGILNNNGAAPNTANFATQMTDPAYAAAFVAYYAKQQGANPSLGNDPNYWIQKITSGALGTDPNYVISKFMTPEGAPAGGAAPGAGTNPVGAGTGAAPIASTLGTGTGTDANALYTLLMNQAQTSLDVNPNDPTIKGPTDAYAATQEQTARNYESTLAESAGPNANIGAETQIAQEEVGQNTAGYQANLMGTELAARRTEIQNALSGASGLLTAEQQMQLNAELNQLNLQEQAYQFDATNTRVTNLGY